MNVQEFVVEDSELEDFGVMMDCHAWSTPFFSDPGVIVSGFNPKLWLAS